MQDIDYLEKKAIQMALSHSWEEAVGLNKKIIEIDPNNVPALNRLGRALIEVGKASTAKKYLKKVLAIDPINKTAQKNMELAKKSKKGHHHTNHHNHEETSVSRRSTSFIHEPGTTKSVTVKVSGKGFTSKSFHTGDSFIVKLAKDRISLYYKDKFVGFLSLQKGQKKLKSVLKSGEKVTAVYKNGSRGKINIIVRTKTPIFEAEKQEIKPYTYFKDDRPEIKIEIEENE